VRVSCKCDYEEIFVTYPVGFDLPIDECPGKSSARGISIVWYGVVVCVIGGGGSHEFFGLGMAVGFTLLRQMLLILFGGPVGGGPSHSLMRQLGFVWRTLVLRGR
jgi:hypothetical protein